MKSIFVVAALEALAASAAAERTLLMNFEKRSSPRPESRLQKRAKVINEPLGNEQILYFANVSVGSPPQSLSLQLDTGSSDVWMTAASSSFCEGSGDPCYGGTFDQTKSSTYQPLTSPIFNISYVDGTGSSGNYFTDNFHIAGAQLKGLQMGLATDTTIGTGIMGVGYADDESVCTSVQCQTYPSVIDQMVNQSAINRKAYSLWLEDLESNTGSVLFGGVDSAKYLPPLVALPIQQDPQSQAITSFTVAWTDLYLNTPKGRVGGLWPGGALAAILDSGTSLMLLPETLANAMYAQFGAVYDRHVGAMVAACSVEKSTALFAFQFGGSDGPTVQVPISEFLIPVQLQNGQPYAQHGVQICEVGIQSTNDPNEPILLGDTFLRSAYVVYDLDNNIIALAQSNFNPGSSNVQEIASGSAAIPGVSSTASGTSASAAYSGRASFAATSAITVGAGATDAISSVSGTPLTQYTALNTNAPSNVNAGRGSAQNTASGAAATSTSKGGAAGAVHPMSSRSEGFLLFGLTAVATLLGSSMLLL